MWVDKIFIASDHAGFEAKEQAKKALAALGYEAVDLGTHSAEASVDYPDFAGGRHKKRVDKLVLNCGAGGTASVVTDVCGAASDDASSCDPDLARNFCEQNSAQGVQEGGCASKISPNESGGLGSNFKTGGGR